MEGEGEGGEGGRTVGSEGGGVGGEGGEAGRCEGGAGNEGGITAGREGVAMGAEGREAGICEGGDGEAMREGIYKGRTAEGMGEDIGNKEEEGRGQGDLKVGGKGGKPRALEGGYEGGELGSTSNSKRGVEECFWWWLPGEIPVSFSGCTENLFQGQTCKKTIFLHKHGLSQK